MKERLLLFLNSHLQKNNISYWDHLCRASDFSLRCAIASIILLIHGLFPFLFQENGSKIIKNLYKDIISMDSKEKI
jgi:hypothetical protein